jgi:hypothetical protein
MQPFNYKPRFEELSKHFEVAVHINMHTIIFLYVSVRLLNFTILLLKDLFIQGAAEMVKHFKILVTCFSARVSRSAGI